MYDVRTHEIRVVIPVRNIAKNKKARAVVEAAAAAGAGAASDAGSSGIAASADRSTAPVVGLLPEAAQLACLPGPETA